MTQFSTANALQNVSRLDSTFLSKLLTKHSSGLSVLSAPDKYTPVNASAESIGKLLSVARQGFDYVVVDAGSSMGATYKTMLEGASIAYLITQVSISELRNSNRLISEFFTGTNVKSNFICALGYGDSTGLFERSPRLSFDEACKIL